MTVAELIEELQRLDPKTPIRFNGYSELRVRYENYSRSGCAEIFPAVHGIAFLNNGVMVCKSCDVFRETASFGVPDQPENYPVQCVDCGLYLLGSHG